MTRESSLPERPAAGRRGPVRTSGARDLAEALDVVLVRLSGDLHALREARDWSLDRTAAAAGVAPQTVLDLEKTRGNPTIATLAKLAEAFGCELRIALVRRTSRGPLGEAI